MTLNNKVHSNEANGADGILFVLGAGVDIKLNLPMASNLMTELANFVQGEGKEFNNALRKHVKYMRYSIEKHAGERGEQLGERLLDSHSHLLSELDSALDKSEQDSSRVQTMRSIVQKIRSISDANTLDENQMKDLQDMGGNRDSEPTPDTLFETRGLSFTSGPRQAIRGLFQSALEDTPNLNDREKEALQKVVSVTTNFEELLGEFFTGFFTGNVNNQKRYFYLSWLLWAYICTKAREGEELWTQSFYSTLSELRVSNIVTFNYTDFFDEVTRPVNGHFHGSCNAYIRLDTRDYIDDDENFKKANTLEAMTEFIANMDTSWEKRKVFIPAIVPPLAVKPIICTEYLETWYEASQKIKDAEKIAVIGYSFNQADEHFNDLLRKNSHGKQLLIVNPDIEAVKSEVCNILSFQEENLNETQFNGFCCYRGNNKRLTFVDAKAEDLDKQTLDDLLS